MGFNSAFIGLNVLPVVIAAALLNNLLTDLDINIESNIIA